MIPRFLRSAIACAALIASPAAAQTELPSQFSSGNEYFPLEIYLSHLGKGVPSVTLYPGEGITGEWFRTRPDGSAGWIELLNQAQMSALAIDWPGTGNASTFINRDLIRALDAHVEGAYFTNRGSLPKLTVAHAEGAAILVKIRSYGDYLSPLAVFIDPIGPQHSQPLEPLTFEEALARQETLEDDLWRQWGFGPRAGVLHEGLDVDLESANRVHADYQRDAFPIRPALLQPMLSPIRVRGPGRLEHWRVLVLRTSAVDDAQVRREQAFSTWLEDAGVHVDLLDLGEDPELSDTTGLPWIGSNAPLVLERILDWYSKNLPLVPPLQHLDMPGEGS